MWITGILGIAGTSREKTSSSKSHGLLLPVPWSEREREEPWKTLVTCLPESGR